MSVILLIEPDAERRRARSREIRAGGGWVVAVESAGAACRRHSAGALPVLDLVVVDPRVGGEDVACLYGEGFGCPVMVTDTFSPISRLLDWAVDWREPMEVAS